MIIGKFAFLSRPPFYAVARPSFDIVSQVNSMEIENAVNQTGKELANGFGFKSWPCLFSSAFPQGAGGAQKRSR